MEATQSSQPCYNREEAASCLNLNGCSGPVEARRGYSDITVQLDASQGPPATETRFIRAVKWVQRPTIWKKVLAEAVGTYSVVFAGCGAMVVNAMTGALTHVGVAIVWGLIVTAMIYTVGHVSGAHFNPAVTLAFSVAGRFPWREVPGYIAAQMVGATMGAGMLLWILGNHGGLGTTVPLDSGLQAFAMEVMLTFFLMFVISAVATDSRAEGTMAGLAIGFTVLLDAMFGGPICGASMNPARSLGPAFVSGIYDSIWAYILGPIVGALIAIGLYELLRCQDGCQPKDAHGCCK